MISTDTDRLIMGLLQNGDMDPYWTSDEIICTPIFSKMSTDRFYAILSYLYVVNNNIHPGDDSLYKVHPCVSMMCETLDVYSPE
jgi:hypothetical protein